MATAYLRLRMLWGAFDLEQASQSSPGYSSSQIVTGGDSAAIGSGVGVRRATIELVRSTQNTLLDSAYVHFDFLNMTAGNPDDTWTSADYTSLETAIKAWCTGTSGLLANSHAWSNIYWHRVGTGVTKPNPAERVTPISPTITGSVTPAVPNQYAASITFKTGVRKSWGRTYFPMAQAPTANGSINTTACDTLATQTQLLVNSAATADMHLVVVSKPLNSSLNVESIRVDNVPDVIRRRRLKKATYVKSLP